MTLRKVMIVRHAEKPPKSGPPPQGVDLQGAPSGDELIPRGWQRAGALVTLFAPCGGSDPRQPIERPSAIFAAGTSASSLSLRPQSTVGPTALASRPPISVQVLSAPGEEAAAAGAIRGSGCEVCLVCWEHKHIKDLVREVTGGAIQSPHWDGTRFDVTLVLTLEAGRWTLQEAPQLLLAGDLAAPVSQRNPNAASGDEE